eukprot:1899983-Pleurochrysis_carterae.AAC.1
MKPHARRAYEASGRKLHGKDTRRVRSPFSPEVTPNVAVFNTTHDAHSDGYGYDGAPDSLISLMTPEYKPPAFDYSNGLCHILPRKAKIVYCHGVGLFYWGRGISVYGSFCNATYFA